MRVEVREGKGQKFVIKIVIIQNLLLSLKSYSWGGTKAQAGVKEEFKKCTKFSFCGIQGL